MKYQIVSLVVLLVVAVPFDPVFAQQKNRRLNCPIIKVECPDSVDQHTMMLCSVTVSGVDDSPGISYRWTASKGEIKEGKNSASVTIDATGAFPATVTATVEVFGLNKSCANRASSQSVLVISDVGPKLLTEYGDITFEHSTGYLDLLAQRLRDDPGSRPYIIAYAGRQAYVNEASDRAEQAKRYLIDKHGIEVDRIVTVDGGFRELRSVELWIEPFGSIASPFASPTLRPEEVQLLKGKRPSEQ